MSKRKNIIQKHAIDSINLESICQQTCQIAADTAAFIKAELGKVQSNDIETKSVNSLVSYVDKQAEIQLVNQLKKVLPDSTFLTEEATIRLEQGAYRWIIDPLDGTTNFLHQIPAFAISVALQYREETILGVVYEINREECFYAWKNGGAYLNDAPITVSQTTQMKDALIATGFPYYDYKWVDNYLAVLKHFMLHTRGIRRIGAAAIDLAYTACGRFDAFFEYSLSPWDVAAGAIIVQEAGGIVKDFKGTDDFLFGKEIVATNKALNIEMMDIIKYHFY